MFIAARTEWLAEFYALGSRLILRPLHLVTALGDEKIETRRVLRLSLQDEEREARAWRRPSRNARGGGQPWLTL